MAMIKVSILLILFIFACIVRAWADPAKSTKDAANQLTTMKMDKNEAPPHKKAGPVKERTESLKKNPAKFRDVDFLRTLEEKKKSQWLESLDEVIYTREFSENGRRNNFEGPLQVKESKSSGTDSGQSILRPYPDGNGYFGEGRIFKTLRLFKSREETFKEIFMGFRFSFDLTYGHLLLEMNVAPSSEKSSGFAIRF
jgi:hypothetical protein